jgi:hypothetical protein
MHPAIHKDHHLFFQKNGWIAFEDSLSSDQKASLLEEQLSLLAEHLKVSPLQLSRQSPVSLFSAGTDLWADAPKLRDLVGGGAWGDLLGALFNCRILRLGGTQSWIWRGGSWSAKQIPFQEAELPWISLQQITSVEGLLGGVFFALETPEQTSVSAEIPLNPFGPLRGAVIVRSDLPLQLVPFFSGSSRTYVCVLFAGKQCSFRLAPLDPQPNRMKALGYYPGQPLSERTHPLLWQR